MARLIHELIFDAAARTPDAPALRHEGLELSYAELARQLAAFGAGLAGLGAARHERVALWLPAGVQEVVALFGTSRAGCTAVPVPPHATPAQVAASMRHNGVRVLVTSAERMAPLVPELAGLPHARVAAWDACLAAGNAAAGLDGAETDIAALLYGAGDGWPRRGLSRHELLAASSAAARYLGIGAGDRLLAALPSGVDHGLIQLGAAFSAGAAAVLLDDPQPEAVMRLVAREQVSGLAALPELCERLATCDWEGAGASLRFVAICGGPLARAALDSLRRALPHVRVHLVYGASDAFRSTCLGPTMRAPDVRNAKVFALRRDGRHGAARAEVTP